jgi:hypothetical protein
LTPAAPDFSNILLSEVQTMNWLFGAQASASNFDTDLITVGTPTLDDPLQFDTVSKASLQAEDGNAFAAMLFGSNWANEISSDPGSYSLFNGALTQFTDANDVLMYALMTGGGEIDAANTSDHLFGSDASIDEALTGDGFLADASNFFQNGIEDLGGYFAAAVTDVDV